MDDQILDLFLTSMVTGVVGGGLMVFATYSFCKAQYVRYFEVRDKFMTTVDVKKLQRDVEVLQMQVLALQAGKGFVG